jgi:hypothetical protein
VGPKHRAPPANCLSRLVNLQPREITVKRKDDFVNAAAGPGGTASAEMIHSERRTPAGINARP